MASKYLKSLFLVFVSWTLLGQTSDFSTGSPYHSIYNFLHFLQPDSYDPLKASRSLNMKGSDLEKQEKAIQLKGVLDGGGYYIILGKLPRDPDYVDSLVGRSVYWPFHERRPEIYLEKYGDQWLFSTETVSAIPGLYDKLYPFKLMKLVKTLPPIFHQQFLDIPIWKYLAVPVLVVVLLIGYYLLFLLLSYLIKFVGNRYITHLRGEERLKRRISSFISLFVITGLGILLLPSIQLPVEVMNFLLPLLNIFRTIIVIIVILRIADVIFLYIKDYVEKTPSKMDDQLLPIFIKGIQVLIITGGLLNVLQELDVNVTALIAGVSIGGLALALAAQDTVKNLIGSSMIFLDKPFQIGDYIVGGSYEGTVEEVGFRTTRIRNVDKSVISVPNGNVANDTITNWGLRPARRMQMTIGILYSTPPDRIEKFLEGIRHILETHPKTSKTDFIVRLHSLGASSIDIFYRVYLFAPTIINELEIREEIMFGIIRLAERVGVSFAFPSTSLYVEQDKPPAADEREEKEVKEDINAFLASYQRRLEDKYRIGEDDSGA